MQISWPTITHFLTSLTKRQNSIRLRLEGRSTPTKPTAESEYNLPNLQALGYNTSLCFTSRCWSPQTPVVQSTIFKTCRIHRPSRSLIHTFHSQSKCKRQKSIRLSLEGRSTPTKPIAEYDCNLPSLKALGYNTSLCSTSYCLVATGNCGTVDHNQNLSHTQTVPYTLFIFHSQSQSTYV
jgi:hypothetical protein